MMLLDLFYAIYVVPLTRMLGFGGFLETKFFRRPELC